MWIQLMVLYAIAALFANVVKQKKEQDGKISLQLKLFPNPCILASLSGLACLTTLFCSFVSIRANETGIVSFQGKTQHVLLPDIYLKKPWQSLDIVPAGRQQVVVESRSLFGSFQPLSKNQKPVQVKVHLHYYIKPEGAGALLQIIGNMNALEQLMAECAQASIISVARDLPDTPTSYANIEGAILSAFTDIASRQLMEAGLTQEQVHSALLFGTPIITNFTPAAGSDN